MLLEIRAKPTVASHAAIASACLALDIFERTQIKSDQCVPKVSLTHAQTATNQALRTTGTRRAAAIGVGAVRLSFFEKIVHDQHGFAVFGKEDIGLMHGSW